MTPVILGLFGAIAIAWFVVVLPENAWGLIRQPPKEFEPGLGAILAVIGGIGSVILFGVMGVGHALVHQRYSQYQIDTALPPTPPKSYTELRVEALTGRLGFQDRGEIAVQNADGTSEELRIFATLPERDNENIVTSSVTLMDSQGNESAFTYSVLFNDFSWQKESERFFQGKHSRPIKIETALLDEYLRRGVEKASRVVCFGLSSSELDTMTEEENEKLSDARAINLCKALFKIGYMQNGPQTAVGVGGGFALDEDTPFPDLQRVAIIVAVHHSTREFRIDAFVLAMNELIIVKGLDLERYSRTPNEFVTTDAIAPGPYLSIEDIRYGTRKSDVVVPIIMKPTTASETEDPE